MRRFLLLCLTSIPLHGLATNTTQTPTILADTVSSENRQTITDSQELAKKENFTPVVEESSTPIQSNNNVVNEASSVSQTEELNTLTSQESSLENNSKKEDPEVSEKQTSTNENKSATNNSKGNTNTGFVESDSNKRYDLSKRKMREVFSITLNNNWIVSAMAIVLEDNDVLIEIRYLDSDVLSAIKQETYREIDGKKYLIIDAKQIDVFDEENLTIEATLPPSIYHPNKIDLNNSKKPKGEPVSAAYVNYSITADPNDFQNTMGAAFNLNYAHKSNWLLRNDFSWDRENKKLWRNSSTFIKEFDNKYQLIAGDTFGAGFNEFTSINFFGGRLTSPYYTNRAYNDNVIPTIDVNGYSVNPGKLDIFLNDKLYQSTNVAAGQYNITVPKLESTGAGILKAVTYDKTGKPIIVEIPFFADSTILKKGAFEYDISAGFLKDTSKLSQFSYSKDMIFNGLMTYGVTENYTQELYLTTSKYYTALGGNTNFVPNSKIGKLSFQWGLNSYSQKYGSFQMSKSIGDSFSMGLKYSRAIGSDSFCFGYTSYTCMKSNMSVFSSWNLPKNLGSLNLNYMNQTSPYDFNKFVSLQYNKQFTQNLSFSASIGEGSSSFMKEKNKSVFFGLNYSFGTGSSSVSSQSSGASTRYQTNLTFNESSSKPWLGYGNISHNRNASGGGSGSTTVFYGANLNKLSYGINAMQQDGQMAYNGNVSGGIYYVPGDNKLGLSKNITSGLAVVEVKNAVGPVGIEHENKLSGFTDSSGFYVVPNITPHNNETISIDINKLPENMIVNEFTKNYQVPANGAIRINFSARPYPYLVRIYGLETGTLISVGDDFYVVGNKGRTTIEQEGSAKIEYKPSVFCELDFKKSQKEYYCGDATPENKFPHAKDNLAMEQARNEAEIQKQKAKDLDDAKSLESPAKNDETPVKAERTDF